MQRQLIKRVLASTGPREAVLVRGWVRTRRDAKGFSFLEMNDGSCLAGLQVVVDAEVSGAEDLGRCLTGASVEVEGPLVASPALGNRRVAAVTSRGMLVIAATGTGEKLAAIDLSRLLSEEVRLYSSPALSGGRIIFGTSTGAVVCLEDPEKLER